jgi:hypothetical protein
MPPLGNDAATRQSQRSVTAKGDRKNESPGLPGQPFTPSPVSSPKQRELAGEYEKEQSKLRREAKHDASDAASLLTRERQVAMDAIRAASQRLTASLKTAADPRPIVQQHPWYSVVGGLAAGALAGLAVKSVIKGRKEQQHPPAVQVQYIVPDVDGHAKGRLNGHAAGVNGHVHVGHDGGGQGMQGIADSVARMLRPKHKGLVITIPQQAAGHPASHRGGKGGPQQNETWTATAMSAIGSLLAQALKTAITAQAAHGAAKEGADKGVDQNLGPEAQQSGQANAGDVAGGGAARVDID